MTQKYSLLSFILLLIFSCHSGQEKLATRGKTPTRDSIRASANRYLNSDFVAADIDVSVDVQKMSVGEVKDLMRKMHNADQQYRDSLHGRSTGDQAFYNRKMNHNDDANLFLLDQIVEKYGWPGRRVFGNNASETAWLVVWHHRDSQEILSRYLPIIETARRNNDIPPNGYNLIVEQLSGLRSR